VSATDLLDELAAVYRELDELEHRHIRDVGVGAVALGWFAGPAAGAGGAVAALLITDAGRHWWLPLLGVVLLVAAYGLGWLAVRRLTAPHGPLGTAYRQARKRRDAVLERLRDLPATPLNDAQAGDRHARVACIGADLTARAGQEHAQKLREYLRTRLIGLLLAVVSLPLMVLFVIALVLAFAEGEPAGLAMAVAVGVSGFAVVRVCILKAGPERRTGRTVRQGRRVQLAVLERQLADAGRAPPGDVPGLWSRRLYAMSRGGGLARLFPTAPHEALRALPPGASRLRRWYVRQIGPGGTALLLAAVLALAIVVSAVAATVMLRS
jgi:hypothetical protein